MPVTSTASLNVTVACDCIADLVALILTRRPGLVETATEETVGTVWACAGAVAAMSAMKASRNAAAARRGTDSV